MGCDIHATIEKKENNLWWGAANNIHIDRSYALFTVLADVRNYNEERAEKNIPISQPRGIPEDVSYEFGKIDEYWDSDGHSHSWVTFKELKEHSNPDQWYKEEDFYKFMEILAKRLGEENVRLVFLFDN